MKDTVMPEEKSGSWKFDEDVTEVFDDMLERSIPQYDVMRKAVHNLALQFRQDDTAIIDLGCSRGEAFVDLVSKYGASNHFIGVEVSDPMINAARDRFRGWTKTGIVEILKLDLRETFPHTRASVVLSVLTLMFTPIEYRLRILSDVYESLVAGGALIIVEKLLASDAKLDAIMVEEYLSRKKEHGYTSDQIKRKKLALEGVLVPVTARMNEEFLHSAGFRRLDCFWRWMNFGGWVAVKE